MCLIVNYLTLLIFNNNIMPKKNVLTKDISKLYKERQLSWKSNDIYLSLHKKKAKSSSWGSRRNLKKVKEVLIPGARIEPDPGNKDLGNIFEISSRLHTLRNPSKEFYTTAP